MNNHKGYKPTRKCITYFRRMISKDTWKLNEKVPTAKNISEKLGVSYSTVRNTLILFEKEGILENYGSLGFFLKSKSSLMHANKGKVLFKSFKMHVEAARLFSEGAIQLQNWIVLFNKDTKILTGLNIISGMKLECEYSLISRMLNKPITLNDLLQLDDNQYKKMRFLYMRQQKLYPLARLILKHKKNIIK